MLISNDFWRVQQLGDAIERNTLELMNIVSAKYLQAGKMMGRPIYISIVGIFNADRKLWLPDSTDTVDASDLLKVCSRIQFTVSFQENLNVRILANGEGKNLIARETVKMLLDEIKSHNSGRGATLHMKALGESVAYLMLRRYAIKQDPRVSLRHVVPTTRYCYPCKPTPRLMNWVIA
jgi:hypothetical protein